MKINEAKNNNSASANGTANTANPVTADKNKVAFVNSNPVNTVSKPKDEAQKPDDEKNVQAEPAKKDAPTVEEPKSEQPKAEVKPEPFKPVMNLDSTVKVVLDLNRKIQHRNRMQTIVANLDEFTVKQEEAGEETGANSLQGCELIIRDDQGRTFSTKNANLIQQSAQFINSLCVEKIAEIEAEIIIPA
ncbi:hypothetical protein BDD43_0173 [Mucilaginibacter gracilis]|uniref:Uncharacterized protein n=1 Tax=Mucilaginibacter gracilis TaxID=423350 RepID=A0A495ITT7_9SPHI|nr:hypothetical protein [Mucilaginibacter gracilis]RKR80080.1 hypothetical protein BDD43_0173 [Mucilaginibacter gracilis]